MWWSIWWVSSNWEIITTNEVCIHIFRDVYEDDTSVTSKCIRCWIERIYNK